MNRDAWAMGRPRPLRVRRLGADPLALPALARFHGGGPLDRDFRGLIATAESVRLAADETRWTAWTRYSSRQGQPMEWTGVVGTATYEGDLAPIWPYLVFGQWAHVGKGATFGLGAIGWRPRPAVIRPQVARRGPRALLRCGSN